MKRDGMLFVVALLTMICVITGPAVLVAGNPEGKATPRRMQGTWSSMIEIPPNDILGNPVTVYMPELDSFTSGGTAITSSAFLVMPLDVDEGPYLAAVEIGQGNWRFKGGQYAMTQWRFLTDTVAGEPLGYLKITAEWSLLTPGHAEGLYLVEMLELDMTTPYEKDGMPVVVEGPFEMWRLPVESLP
jgi:hypothetical protein